jgi:hypothetical protein
VFVFVLRRCFHCGSANFGKNDMTTQFVNEKYDTGTPYITDLDGASSGGFGTCVCAVKRYLFRASACPLRLAATRASRRRGHDGLNLPHAVLAAVPQREGGGHQHLRYRVVRTRAPCIVKQPTACNNPPAPKQFSLLYSLTVRRGSGRHTPEQGASAYRSRTILQGRSPGTSLKGLVTSTLLAPPIKESAFSNRMTSSQRTPAHN